MLDCRSIIMSFHPDPRMSSESDRLGFPCAPIDLKGGCPNFTPLFNTQGHKCTEQQRRHILVLRVSDRVRGICRAAELPFRETTPTVMSAVVLRFCKYMITFWEMRAKSFTALKIQNLRLAFWRGKINHVLNYLKSPKQDSLNTCKWWHNAKYNMRYTCLLDKLII